MSEHDADARLRDHFAAAALTGLLSSREWPIDSDEAAHYCYRVADAMLRERGNRQAAPDSSPVTEPMPNEKRAEVSVSEPVAWAVMPSNSDYCVTLSTRKEAAQKAAERKVEVGEYASMDDIVIAPLYRQPQPTLTDAERDALHYVVGDVADITGPIEATLRGLLERTK